MRRAAQTFWRLAGPVVPFLLSPRNAKDTSESVRGDAGVQSTVGVTQAPAPPECGASPHASPPGRGTQRPQGSSQSSLSGSHRHIQLSAGVIRSHCHCRPPLPWFPGLFGAERPWTVSVGVQHGGFVTKSGCYLRHSGPPRGDDPGHRTLGTLGRRGCGISRSTTIVLGVWAPCVKQSSYVGPGQANKTQFHKRSSKITTGYGVEDSCLRHSTKAISQNSRNVPCESRVPGTEADGAEPR